MKEELLGKLINYLGATRTCKCKVGGGNTNCQAAYVIFKKMTGRLT